MQLANRFPIALLAIGLPIFAGSAPGIKNFDRVDAHVYRGAQPTADGFQYLATLGVKTIIDLREAGSRSKAEERLVTGLGMKYVNVPMGGFTPPSEAQINKILALLEDGTTGPIFVHCWRGADRAGTVIAAYHIDHDGWDNARALQDAKVHHMSVFQLPRQDYIKNFHARVVDAKATRPAAAASLVPKTPAVAGLKN